MPSLPPLNTHVHASVLLYALLGCMAGWTLACILVGYIIGTRRGSVRIIFVPTTRRKFYCEQVPESAALCNDNAQSNDKAQ